MRYIIIILLALLTLPEVGKAQEGGMNVGYCNGELGNFPSTTDNWFAEASTRKQVWTSGAILLTPEKIKSLAGNQITEVKAGLSSGLNIDSLAVWVSESLDGPVIAADTLTSMSKGWNTVKLSAPVDITAEMTTLYIGYSYHQKSTCKGLSCIEAPVNGYSAFIRSADGEWQDFSNRYALCIEAVVCGGNLPRCDLALTSLDVQKNYVVDEGALSFTIGVRNNAVSTISGFDACCSLDGTDVTYTVHCDSVLAYNQTVLVPMTIHPDVIQTMDPAERMLTVTLTNLNEGEDEMLSDNSLSAPFSVTLHSFKRNVLLEEFTTEKCSNCPRVAGYFHEAMNEPEFAGRLNTMENHAGYYTDNFTATFHNDWTWLFDNVYAPGVMYDRHAADGEITAVSCPGSKTEFYENIRKRLSETAFVSLKIKADVDTTEQIIHVTVTGQRAKSDFTTQAPRITVVLTETNLKALFQAGTTDTDYYHYNVGRRVNSTWGEVLEWQGDDYTYTCDLPYTKNYVMENLGILAFIHDFDATDKTRCEVANSAAITSDAFTGITVSGIHEVSGATSSESVEYYDLSGRRLSDSYHGICIMKKGGRTIKVIR